MGCWDARAAPWSWEPKKKEDGMSVAHSTVRGRGQCVHRISESTHRRHILTRLVHALRSHSHATAVVCRGGGQRHESVSGEESVRARVESAAVGWDGAGPRSNEEEIMLEAFQVVTNGAAKATPGDLVELVEQTTGERPQVGRHIANGGHCSDSLNTRQCSFTKGQPARVERAWMTNTLHFACFAAAGARCAADGGTGGTGGLRHALLPDALRGDEVRDWRRSCPAHPCRHPSPLTFQLRSRRTR